MDTEPDTAGQFLRLRRKAGKVSQEQLAEAVRRADRRSRANGSSVSQWEKGIHHPRRQTALIIDEYLQAGGAIARRFGYSADPPEPETQREPASAALSPEFFDTVVRNFEHVKDRLLGTDSTIVANHFDADVFDLEDPENLVLWSADLNRRLGDVETALLQMRDGAA